MSRSPAAANLWDATGGPPVATAALEGDRRADAVVIGGGFTGLSAALHLAGRGASVILLEARRIGHGGSGRNVGLVNAGLWLPPDAVERRLGAVAGARLNAALADAPGLVFDLIRQHGIGCDARRGGTLHLAHAPAGLRDLARRRDQLRRRGAPVVLLDAAEAARRAGSGAFHGALFDPRAGTLHPLAYARGLARAAQAAGARLHQDAPALAIRRRGGAWQVDTPGGRVTAASLIRATNAYSAALPAPRHAAMEFFQVATAPLEPHARARILPGGEGAWDTAPVMTSLRLDGQGRLLLGAVGRIGARPERAVHLAWARRKLAALFPDLGDVPFRFVWSGRIAMTEDHLPRIERIGQGGLSIHGYGGRGIAPGTAFGKAAAAWCAGGGDEVLPLDPVAARPPARIDPRPAVFAMGSLAVHAMAARAAARPRR
ncbi:MAG: NAD(P)/FAD-dependent oxidoreductase [Pseudooceanicola nanhaiensis]